MRACIVNLIELVAKALSTLLEKLVGFVQYQPLDAKDKILLEELQLYYVLMFYLEKSSRGGD